MLALSLVLNAVLLGVLGAVCARRGLISRAARALIRTVSNPGPPPVQETFLPLVSSRYSSTFEILPSRPGQVILLGDSLTAEGPWTELLGELSVVNRGIPGDGAQGVLARLDEVLDRKPAAVFLMVGINDIASRRPLVKILRDYDDILARLVAGRESGTKLFAASVLPVDDRVIQRLGQWPVVDPRSITSLNEGIGAECETHGVRYLDLHERFATPDGRLRAELTTDGVHLNGAGYLIWRDEVLKALKGSE